MLLRPEVLEAYGRRGRGLKPARPLSRKLWAGPLPLTGSAKKNCPWCADPMSPGWGAGPWVIWDVLPYNMAEG